MGSDIDGGVSALEFREATPASGSGYQSHRRPGNGPEISGTVHLRLNDVGRYSNN